jgi:hypothetical protein
LSLIHPPASSFLQTFGDGFGGSPGTGHGSSSTALVLGVTFGILILIAAGLLIFCVTVRRRKSQAGGVEPEAEFDESDSSITWDLSEVATIDDDYDNPLSVTGGSNVSEQFALFQPEESPVFW